MTVATTSARVKGRLTGAILLISGTAIGAAMLALPVSTGRAGLIPSLIMMACISLYLVYAAFCLLEVRLSMPRESNLHTMAEATLGKTGKYISWGAYLFLLYALNTAYLFGMTQVLHSITTLPREVCVVPLLALLWLYMCRGMGFIDLVNRLCMVGVGASFILLCLLALPYVSSTSLTFAHWHYVIPSISIVVCAFGYHIVIPSLVTYLDGDVKALKKAIWIGGLLPLVVYAVWQVIALGIVPKQEDLFAAYNAGLSSAELLARVSTSRIVSALGQSFAFFAMITSFIGVSMSLIDFLKDGLKNKSSWRLFVIGFLPSCYFALHNERIFLQALEYAGAYGVVILLALLPACMVWQKRYALKRRTSFEAPGGKLFLALFIAVSIVLIGLQSIL